MKILLCITIGVLLVGCAKTYKPIHIGTISVEKSKSDSPLSVEYSSDVFLDSRNLSYGKKAAQLPYQLIALKIKNNSNQSFSFANDLTVTSGNREINLFPTSKISTYLRQPKGRFAWWLLLMLVNGSVTKTECSSFSGCEQEKSFIPIGLILGPVISLINFGVASSSDAKLTKDLRENDCLEKNIEPNSTIECFTAIRDIGSSPIKISLKESSSFQTEEESDKEQQIEAEPEKKILEQESNEEQLEQ